MIRIVPDTSVLIKGLLSVRNNQRQLLNMAYAKDAILYGSSITYKEFCEKIKSGRFQEYLQNKYSTPEKLISDYEDIVTLIQPSKKFSTLKFTRDKDDDEFFRVALTCNSNIIVSEDKHILEIRNYRGVRTVNSQEFIEAIKKAKREKLFG